MCCPPLSSALIFVDRRRVEFGIVNDASMSLSDADLLSLVREIHSQFPTIGTSTVWGHICARGYRVTREQVRSSLRRVDPLSAALRWPGVLTVRRPYSVAGPNSLWHIGDCGIGICISSSYVLYVSAHVRSHLYNCVVCTSYHSTILLRTCH